VAKEADFADTGSALGSNVKNCSDKAEPLTAKLEVKFELTGLKFEITGERDDVSVALASLQQQVANLAQSAASAAGALDGHPPQHRRILNGQVVPTGQPVDTELSTRGALTAPAVRSKSKRGSGTPRSKVEAVQFTHDAEKYRFPKQEWNTANKAMWLLYVMEMQTTQKEASAHVIAATFKLYFKEFGNLLTHNIVRDLGSSKKKGLVNSDPIKTPETWYLLASGKTAIQSLIQNPNAPEASGAE
jgi:hypothetical protein